MSDTQDATPPLYAPPCSAFCEGMRVQRLSQHRIKGEVDYVRDDGYPCQPFSLSGKRKGEDDDRHLWPEVRRITAAARPRWLVETQRDVANNIFTQQVLDDLASLGYTCAPPVVLPACAVGNWHRRDRVVGVAHGIPHWVDRARGTGNAIVPQVAAEILRCMMRVDSLHNDRISDSRP